MSTMKRSFPPLYQPTGDADTDRLVFFHVLERLKVLTIIAIRTHAHLRIQTQKRTGWIDHNVSRETGLSMTNVLHRFRTRRGTFRLACTRLVRAHFGHSISDHMYRMAVLAMCTSDVTLDVSKSVSLAYAHSQDSFMLIIGV